MSIDSDKANLADKLLTVGEFEHMRRHALRSMVSPNIKESERIKYAIIAERAKENRREFMRKHFPDLADEDWCLVKLCCSLRQLAYETFDGEIEELVEIEDLIDSVLGKAFKQDMTGCIACEADREEDKKEEA